ncbi:MAG TPA: 1-acyl-sn-glycerol-3-phosphate acyltransferase [Thermoanaerobaculia bacterium]
MRRALTSFFRFALRLFFRRIEVVGVERIPIDSPVVFAANHPNGLVDPLFIVCFAPRPVSFLAKAPLFRYPLIGYFVRVFHSIPVYRKQDGASDSNRETFGRARDVLRSGGSIAIFPEGTTHSDPRLRELKTGAARIALGAELPSVAIVPAGIYYTAKQTFRSEALVWFGEAIDVRPVALGEDGEPPVHAALELTSRIEQQLASVTLQADSHAALELIGRAERIFSAGAEQPLAAEFELRRRFIAGYHRLREEDPERLERLASAIRQFESELCGARLEAEELSPRLDRRSVVSAVALLPVAIAGIVVHFVPYRIVDALSRGFSRDANEMTATFKFVAALLLYPVTWIVVALLIAKYAGAIAAVVSILILPLTGYAALRFVEELDEITGSARALLHRAIARGAHARLVAHRQLIRDEIIAVAESIGESGTR